MKRVRTEVTEYDTADLVKINAGGKVYYTTHKTLTANFPQSLLACLFKRRETIPLDEHGNYFIDVDPTLFGGILNVLRRPSLVDIVPQDVKEESWWLELDYWGIKDYTEMHVIEEETPLVLPESLATKAQLFKETCVHAAIRLTNTDIQCVDHLLTLCGFDKEIMDIATHFEITQYMAEGVVYLRGNELRPTKVVGAIDIVNYIAGDRDGFATLIKNVMGFDHVTIKQEYASKAFTFYGQMFCASSGVQRLHVHIKHSYRKK